MYNHICVYLYYLASYIFCIYTAESDFTPGRYNATFTPGTTTATANIIILRDDNDEGIKQFSLRLFIDDAAYQQCIFSGSVSTAAVYIISAPGIYY